MYTRIRRPIVIVVALLFHLLLIFHLLFSPVIIVAASWKGIINASFVVYLLIFLVSLFFGRAFCSWFCPGCGIQEILALFVRRKSPNSRAIRLKYVIFALWLGIIVTGYAFSGFRVIDLKFGMTDITLQRKIILTVGAGLLILPLTLIFGRFASCKYICWMAPFLITGTRIRNFFHWRGLRLKADPAACTACESCNKACSMNLDVVKQVQSGKIDHPECILCGNCIDHCKSKAIKFTFSR
jgi:ferredoxin-type protein NapH